MVDNNCGVSVENQKKNELIYYWFSNFQFLHSLNNLHCFHFSRHPFGDGIVNQIMALEHEAWFL
jgi:hypothetical protein